jgi:predicted PurR-regulated permease PerM
MPSEKNSLNKYHSNPRTGQSRWAERRDIPIAIIAWIALAVFTLWAASFVIQTILVIVIASLLAYALTPAVKLLSRVMPRALAILIVYLVVLTALGFLLYFLINTTIAQVTALITNLRAFLSPNSKQLAAILAFLKRYGISQQQINGFIQQIINQAEGFIGGIVPLISSIINGVLDFIIVAVLSVYLLMDGPRLKRWIEQHAPDSQKERINFSLNTLNRVVGGYIRGQFTLSLLIGILVGVGMALFHVPYAELLGVMAFVLEFIPVLGTLTSGAICVLIALSQGWLIALGVLIYFIGVHIFEGEVVGPRIVGGAIGIHPAISLIALITGASLFGIWGALLASPIAGLIQAVLVAIWQNWRDTHPEQFSQQTEDTSPKAPDQEKPAPEQEKEEILE